MRHGFDEVLRALTKLALCPLTGTREGRVPSTGGCSGQEEEGHTNTGAGASHGKLRWSWTGLGVFYLFTIAYNPDGCLLLSFVPKISLTPLAVNRHV